MDKITTVGLDLAKQVMAVHGVDTTGRMVMRKVLRRDQVLPWSAALPPCVIATASLATMDRCRVGAQRRRCWQWQQRNEAANSIARLRERRKR